MRERSVSELRSRPAAAFRSSCFGPCADCGTTHALPEGRARAFARALMREFETIRRLDHLVDESDADPALGFDHLFPGGHGNMFGVLECVDARGETVVLRAFSSLRRGVREVAGWVPPLLPADVYYGRVEPARDEIEALTARLEGLDREAPEYGEVHARRTALSRELLADLNSHYRFHNFRGEARGLDGAFHAPGGRPGGVGECCAPKLLNYAATHDLRPLGMVEFYWGDSSTKRAGEFYPCCAPRCQPILGFMLCGLDDG